MSATPLLKVRTVTTGITLARGEEAKWVEQVRAAHDFNAAAQKALEAAGFEVQSTRVSTNPFEEYVDVADAAAALESLRTLDAGLAEMGCALFNLGPARSDAAVALVCDIVKLSPRLFLSANVPHLDFGRAKAVGEVVRAIGDTTERGEGNFQFCAAFNVKPGIPFFPAAYHAGPPSFAIGCETADVLAAALPGDLGGARERVIETFTAQMRPIEAVAEELAAAHGMPFDGLDASVAPNPEVAPITAAFEGLGLGTFGGSGTLAVAELVTSALKSLPVKLCGYSGLMLPPLEDAGLAQRANEGRYRVADLMVYSSVCGLGLDTVPVPGAAPPERLAALFLDISALATRLDKPLTARLFPVPGKAAGEMTAFQHPHLCNCRVFDVA